ncbi:MAG: hypothetical protein ABS900_00740 [Candidatus Limivicinus sp.]
MDRKSAFLKDRLRSAHDGRADPKDSEVSFITRQQFMTELSKLLTFMYEEDRQRALKMYERMFNIAEDDQGLIQHLMSPTRQAVVIARAYDAKERKLSVSAQKKGDDFEEEEDTPSFVLAINRIFDEIFPEEEPEQPQAEDQVSFFDLGVDSEKAKVKKPVVPRAEVLLSDTQNFQPIVPSDIPEEEESVEEVSREEESVEELPDGEDTTGTGEEEDDDSSAPERKVPIISFSLDDFDEKPEEPEADSTEAAEADAGAAENIVTESEQPEAPEEAEETAEPEELKEPEETEKPEEEEKDLVQTVHNLFPEEKKTIIVEKAETPGRDEPKKRRRSIPMKQVTNVPLLVLFVIAAIPVTLTLLAVLLFLTLLSLGTAVGMIALGVTLILAAFSGFAVLADVLMLFGAALIALALGLVFLWTTFWLVGGVMVGLVRWVIGLGRKWCTKEVPAE